MKIKANGVKVYVSNGKTYAYHRKSGKRLLSPYGTGAFFTELAALDKPITPSHPGTWGGLVGEYRKGYLSTLKPRTREDYEKVLSWVASLDGMPLLDWSRGFALKLRDKAYQQHGRRFANYVIAVVQSVFTWALDREYIDTHPVKGIKIIKRPKELPRANRPWARQEWNVVIGKAPPHLLAPILLCSVLGWREGEALSRPRTDYDGKTIKRVSTKSGKVVKTPVPGIVSAALDALQPHSAPTLLVNRLKRPWTGASFRMTMRSFLRKLEDSGEINKGLTVHGLRHTCGTMMRELGFDLQTIADMLGQETAGMAAWYSRDAELKGKLEEVVRKIDDQLG